MKSKTKPVEVAAASSSVNVVIRVRERDALGQRRTLLEMSHEQARVLALDLLSVLVRDGKVSDTAAHAFAILKGGDPQHAHARVFIGEGNSHE